MSDWESVRRQVAIAGMVRDGESPFAAAAVSALRSTGPATTKNAHSRADGSFFFLDLPDGDYNVTAAITGKTGSAPAHVERKGDGTLPLAWVELQMQAPRGTAANSRT